MVLLMNYLVSAVEGECFNNTAQSIMDHLNRVEYCLEFERKFENKTKTDLDQALLMIPLMIEHLSSAPLYQSENFLGMCIGRIILLGKIEQKVQAIREFMHPVISYPVKKKECVLRKLDDTLPALKTRIQKLVSGLIGSYRLPFGSFDAWNCYYHSVETSLNGETKSLRQAKVKQIEIFHLLADKFGEEDVEIAGSNRLGGSDELHAAISYSRILSELLLVPSIRKEVVQFLLDRVNQAKQIALKTAYITHMEKNKSAHARQAYFSDLLKLVYDGKYFTLDKLNQIYKLSLSNCPIPAEVVLGDVCHDLVKMIADLKVGDKRIFCAGTTSHQVLIEIECNQEQEFFYTILNTGEGSDINLEDDDNSDDQEFAKPITYGHLKRETFTHEFFTKLMGYSYNKRATIEDFYEFHWSQLITKAKGVIDYEYAPMVRSQYFEICTYAIFDEWVDSHLLETEITEKERIKVRNALSKQAQAIETIYSQAIKKKSATQKVSEMPKRIPNMLKQAFRLRHLCEKYQNNLDKEDGEESEDIEMNMV